MNHFNCHYIAQPGVLYCMYIHSDDGEAEDSTELSSSSSASMFNVTRSAWLHD